MSSLVRCLKAVADSYNPAILDTTIPSNLFGSLVKLLAVKDPGKICVDLVLGLGLGLVNRPTVNLYTINLASWILSCFPGC